MVETAGGTMPEPANDTTEFTDAAGTADARPTATADSSPTDRAA